MPQSTTTHNNSESQDLAKRLTHAEQEKAKREESLRDSIKQLREIIVTYINTIKAQRSESLQLPTKPWDKVETDLAKIDRDLQGTSIGTASDTDLPKAEAEMRNLNIRATSLYIDALEQRVKRAKDNKEDPSKIRELEGNLAFMKKCQGKAVFPTKKGHGKVEDDVE